MAKKTEATLFSVTFKKGQAEEGRLPLAHVIETLRELDAMIRDVGIQVQRENGVENPDGDFGVELLAGASGRAFKKGSIRSNALLTRDVENGIETVNRIMETTTAIEERAVVSIDQYRAPVVRRFARISTIQEQDKTELRLQLVTPGQPSPRTAKFSSKGVETIRQMERDPAEFSVEAMTLYGKLRQLRDQSRTDDEADNYWGELLEDNGHVWRVRIRKADMKEALGYFAKQVAITGDAAYFKTRSPRLDARVIREDKERNYIAGFDAFEETFSDVFGDRDPQDILEDIRG